VKKVVIMLSLGLLTSTSVWAKEITPETLIGRYKAEAKVAFTRYYLNMRVLDENDFEIQRVYPNGRKDELCNGTYNIGPSLFRRDMIVLAGKSFKGVFSCPSDRSKKNNFNINFGDKKIEDLEKGTSVIVTTSAAPGMRLSTYVKKQP
jgi:hypothetical protein